MNKLMSSLVAATIVGAFSMSATAADAAKATPAAADKHAKVSVKHTVKAEEKKSDAAAMPAAPAKK